MASRPDPEFALETDRLLLRLWRVSDAALQRELWTERDPRVPPHRRIDAHGHPTLHDLEERVRAGVQPRLLAVEVKASGEVIGYCGLIDSDYGAEGAQPGEPELAFEFLRRTWNQGYATEAAQSVISWARALGYRRLWAGVRDWNLASRRVLAKLGFVETDRVDRDALHGDSLLTTRLL
ncbi:MAG: GNAT family N-acetyltransferase [Pseudolysinimonas sp.]|uniref:GNAT family N-acetyltransferase n=1 Tax=Pseudolysinimonas sp. TaxID=2680009 RepID=UPI0032655E54